MADMELLLKRLIEYEVEFVIVGGFAAAAVEATTRADFVAMFELNAVTAFLSLLAS